MHISPVAFINKNEISRNIVGVLESAPRNEIELEQATCLHQEDYLSHQVISTMQDYQYVKLIEILYEK